MKLSSKWDWSQNEIDLKSFNPQSSTTPSDAHNIGSQSSAASPVVVQLTKIPTILNLDNFVIDDNVTDAKILWVLNMNTWWP